MRTSCSASSASSCPPTRSSATASCGRQTCVRSWKFLTGAREDDEHRELLVGGEPMVGARLDEDRMALPHGNALTFHLEHARALEHEIDLVVLVGLLPVRLRGDEHVD